MTETLYLQPNDGHSVILLWLAYSPGGTPVAVYSDTARQTAQVTLPLIVGAAPVSLYLPGTAATVVFRQGSNGALIARQSVSDRTLQVIGAPAVPPLVNADATDGPVTVTLPSGAARRDHYTIRKTDATANPVRLVPFGDDEIDAPVAVTTQGASATVFRDRAGIWSTRDITQAPGAVVSPPVPASGVPLLNPFPRPAAVTVTAGTLTGITVDGVVTGLTAGTVILPPDRSISVAYTVAPTWIWVLF